MIQTIATRHFKSIIMIRNISKYSYQTVIKSQSLRTCSSLIFTRPRSTVALPLDETSEKLKSTKQSTLCEKVSFKTPIFDDPQHACKSKSTVELLQAYFVFKMCSIKFFAKHQSTVSITSN